MDSYYRRNQRHHHKYRRRRFFSWVLVVIILLVYAGYCLVRPLSPAVATLSDTSLVSETNSPNLNWPAGAESAIGTYSSGLLTSSSKNQAPLPTASIAKLITALTVLQDFPLTINQEGPTIQLGSRDVQLYNDYFAKDGSLVEVKEGEKLSEHQALEAMLLPSANNMADSLALWAYGSLAKYRVAAQNEVESLGMHDTIIGNDASGFDPSTTSTPSDLIKLGQAVLANPLLKQIVGQKNATVPVAGKIQNVNYLLGNDGIIGIKTGNSDQAKGNLLFAANYDLDKNNKVVIIGVIMHAKNLLAAMKAATPLLDETKKQIGLIQVVRAGEQVATYSAPWLDKPISVTAENSLELPLFTGQDPKKRIEAKIFEAPKLLDVSGATTSAGATIGKMMIGSGVNQRSTDLIASQAIPAPSIFWRLTHPL